MGSVCGMANAEIKFGNIVLIIVVELEGAESAGYM
jgi:hypothetical protein